jgi:creatinine amidohydrolase
VGAIELDKLTWPEVETELERGRDTVVIAFGATEQHGPHLPLATDALLGDHLSREVAERIDAFLAPTVRIGCSSHHLDFPGTLSVADETFYALVADIVASLAGAGFRRIVLIPTHGGNFAPLATAVEKLREADRERVVAFTDLGALLTLAAIGRDEFDVPLGEGGIHAGEWETSMLLAIHPELVDTDRAEAGFVGDPAETIPRILSGGVKPVADNGVLGDPAQATADHGRRYWEAALEIILERVGKQ